jgi:hypothetical protein
VPNPNCPTCGLPMESIWWCADSDPTDDSDQWRVGWACEQPGKDHFYETYDHPELITTTTGTYFVKMWGGIQWATPPCPSCGVLRREWKLDNKKIGTCDNCGANPPCPSCGNEFMDPNIIEHAGPPTRYQYKCHICWFDSGVP